ncbi:g8401 [Coccomyxa viridis]|uniref:G8401 protein n=1 Tax=Coccomyxa viridis TaxID=1274662 RepID=A0ABP1G4R9_9CHLO
MILAILIYTIPLSFCLTERSVRSSSTECSESFQNFNAEYADVRSSPSAVAAENVFFLHIPRTAGRTYYFCFLKMATPPSRRCEKSYDVLRLNTSIADCGLLGSHDDLSVMQYLPKDTAVVTQLRNPVDRILSAYEFVIEVASRQVLKLNPRKKPKRKLTSTKNVWPWSYLAPWMEADMTQRQAARSGAAGTAGAEGSVGTDPYDNGLFMPLRQFIEEPIVQDLLHNGAALQVLGATNYTHWKDGHGVRACSGSATLHEELQAAAIARLDTFAHVGIMEDLEGSILSLAASMGLKLGGPAWKAATDAFEEGEGGRVEQVKPDGSYRHPEPLGRAHEMCVARARKKAATRKAESMRALVLPDGSHVDFGKDTRAAIDPKLIQRIRELNAADEALWQHGKTLHAAALQRHKEDGTLAAVSAGWREIDAGMDPSASGSDRQQSDELRRKLQAPPKHSRRKHHRAKR